MTTKPSTSSLMAATICGLVSAVLYVGILILSHECAYEVPQAERPVLPMIGLFSGCFLLYLTAQWLLLRQASSWTTVIVVGFAVLFRLLLLGSEPFQEIDIYRYIWDGVASCSGVNPYEYPPSVVVEANSATGLPDDLRPLVHARDASPAVKLLLERVHYGELPTVYPPVSQVVFAAATWTCPTDAGARTRVVWMKAWLLLFDLGIVTLLVPLLRLSKMHPGWLASYSWCPLVLKEFANSGHLDSIAVFLMILAVYWIARALFSTDETWSRTLLLFAAAFRSVWQSERNCFLSCWFLVLLGAHGDDSGSRIVLVPACSPICTTAICLWPMAGRAGSEDDDVSPNAVNQLNVDPLAIEEQPPEPDVAVSRDRQAGLEGLPVALDDERLDIPEPD